MPFTKEQIESLGITYKEGMTDDEVMTELQARNSKITSLEEQAKKDKDIISARNSEIAKYKKEAEAKLTDDEKAKAYQKELEEKVANLEKQNLISERTKGYIGAGYDEALANEIALAEVEGKPTAELHKKFLTAHDEKLKAELMKNNPDPNAQKGNQTKYTRKDFLDGKIGYEELCKLEKENPELYKEITK